LKKLLVISCAALGTREARRAGLDRFGLLAEAEPAFPALTVPAQAALLTGREPAACGAVANGFYFRQLRRAMFWEQAADLIEGRRLWERIEEEHSLAVQAALLFMQNSVGSNADCIVTPAPVHTADGAMIPALATQPAGLDAELEAKLGPFPLHAYWGPLAGLDSSRWIARATGLVMERRSPELVFTYLPHLDYDLQRCGPESEEAGRAAGELGGLLEELVDQARRCGYMPVIVGDYAMETVRGLVRPNVMLRQAGLLAVRRVGPHELVDFGASLAFAVVDHQIAHVYCQNGFGAREMAEAFARAAGVGRVLEREAFCAAGPGHDRTGDLVLEAAPGFWFGYEWWTDEAAAPPFAATVDIHSKPGYDPLELFGGAGRGRTARDASLIRGTHGRAGTGPAALVLPEEFGDLPGGGLRAADLNGLLAAFAAG
jgi:predicted AlkP superfamily pyrophosphatase or phosphodiesterase